MSLPRLIAAMKGAGCSAEQIGQAVLTYAEGGRSGNAERQARFRARKKLEREAAESETEETTNQGKDNVTTNVISNVTDNASRNAERNATDPEPSRARVLCGEEVSIYPLENATHSIPQGGNEPADQPKAKKPRARVSRLSEDFAPTASMRNYAKRHGLSDAQIDAEGEAIRDWSLSAPAGAKLDWEATWRGWVRRTSDRLARAGPPPNGHAPPRRENRLSPEMNALKVLFDECTSGPDEADSEHSWPDAPGSGFRAVGGFGGAR